MTDSLQASPTVDKVVVDVDLVNGSLNESIAEEATDWTKDLTDIQNLVPTPGQFILRPGALSISQGDDNLQSTNPYWRLGALNGGLGAVGASYQLYHWNEKTQQMANKGRMPEFSVQRKQAGGTAEVSSVCGVAGVAITSNHYCIAYHGEVKNSSGTTVSQLIIDILDQLSNNVVRSYTITSAGLHTYSMVGVDSRYLHIYRSLPGTSNPAVAVIDTGTTLAASGAIAPSFTNFTSSANTDFVTGVVAIAGASVAVITGTNNRIEKFNNSGVSVTNAAVAGFTTLSGLDTDGTNFYVAGRIKSLTTPATLSLCTWWRTSAMTATASAGASGTDTATATAVGAGPVLNGVTSASFGTTSTVTSTTTRAMTNGTIIMLVNIAAPLTKLFNFGAFSNGICYTTTAGFGILDNVGAVSSPFDPWPANNWCALVVKWTGGTYKVKVNRQDWVTIVPATNIGSNVVSCSLGTNPNASTFNLMEFMAATSELTNSQVDDVIDYFNTTYALSL